MTARSISAGSGSSERAVTPSVWSRIWSRERRRLLFLLPWFIGFFGLTIGADR